jgi:putative transposase
VEEKRSLIEVESCEDLSVREQCRILKLGRSTFYYEPVPVSDADKAVMDKIDEIYTAHPYFGARRMALELKDPHKITIGRKHTATLMRLMGLEAVFPKRNLSKRHPDHPVYPYLLRGVEITHSNQVWSMDITYIKLGKGFVYLAAVIDWKSRYVLSGRISNTLTSDFCIEALREALEYGTPEIFNTDQGSQFTDSKFIKVLVDSGIRISMDGRGRALDNIFVERLWRSVKYECVYLKGFENIPQAEKGLKEYFEFYNMNRKHQSLQYKTPWIVYSGLEVAPNPNPVA